MYNFIDKDGASVTLRPEMTPSLARMVLLDTNLVDGTVKRLLPIKWFSIPQCWRYETTQRGRKREHYQVAATATTPVAMRHRGAYDTPYPWRPTRDVALRLRAATVEHGHRGGG
jgi:hypothetical protein